jgi:dUTP pyrophosphatase
MNYKNLLEEIKKLDGYISDMGEDIDYNLLFQEHGVDIKSLEEEMNNYSPKLDLGYKKISEDAITPNYNYESDSGFDLYSTEEIVVKPLGRALIPTGLVFDIKDGHEIQVRSKSGLAINQGLFVLNSPGTVDNGYLGEIKVIIFNTNSEPFTIKKGMKVAQAVLCPVVNGKWVELLNTESLSSKDRGDNGFGSTGI